MCRGGLSDGVEIRTKLFLSTNGQVGLLNTLVSHGVWLIHQFNLVAQIVALDLIYVSVISYERDH